jgi:hypothetical protein
MISCKCHILTLVTHTFNTILIMPSFGATPEALLFRNDSKNPSTTCKGLTSSGRPCRRALSSLKSSPLHRRKDSALGGVVALVEEDGRVQEADFYCWQHKDQAVEQLDAEKRHGGRMVNAALYPLKERSSIDTMVQKLGLEDGVSRTKTKNPKPPTRTATHDFGIQAEDKHEYVVKPPVRRGTKAKKPGFWSSLCYMASGADDDYVEIVRHRKRTEQTRLAAATVPTHPNRPLEIRRLSGAEISSRKPDQAFPTRPLPQQRRSSNAHTDRLLSLIPPHLSPQTTSSLLAELIKPISPHDEEGYIYIFWLTPQSKPTPGRDTARSLLTPTNSRPPHAHRISDVMTEFSLDGPEAPTCGKKTILLKIGRASNVTRRMNEWQKQCGYKLNLVRWYPYVPTSAAPSPQPSPGRETLYPDLSRPPAPSSRRESEVVRKVPFVKRVERLVHLELAEGQVKKQCDACGKEHREWFEVEASQCGVRGVDDCVRRWVGWAEEQAGI